MCIILSWVVGITFASYIGGWLGTYVANKENEANKKEWEDVLSASEELNRSMRSLQATLEQRKQFYSNFK